MHPSHPSIYALLEHEAKKLSKNLGFHLDIDDLKHWLVTPDKGTNRDEAWYKLMSNGKIFGNSPPLIPQPSPLILLRL